MPSGAVILDASEAETAETPAAAGVKRKHDGASEEPSAEQDAACAEDFRKWESSPRPSTPALEQLELWRDEMERYGMFEVMNAVHARLAYAGRSQGVP